MVNSNLSDDKQVLFQVRLLKYLRNDILTESNIQLQTLGVLESTQSTKKAVEATASRLIIARFLLVCFRFLQNAPSVVAMGGVEAMMAQQAALGSIGFVRIIFDC